MDSIAHLLVQQEESSTDLTFYWTMLTIIYSLVKNVTGLNVALETFRQIFILVLTSNRDILVSYE